MNKRIRGVILSYVLIVIDIIVGILFVPFLLSKLGADEYGIYKLMQSTASYLSVLDFGIGGTITRYIVKYKTEKDKKSEVNFMAMGLIIYGILSAIVIIAGVILSIAIPHLYKTSINPNSATHAQIILFILCLTTAVSLFNHAYNGLITAYEQFTYNKLSNVLKIILRVCLICVAIRWIQSALVIVLVDFALTVILLICNIIFCSVKLKFKFHLYFWDKMIAKEAGVFTIAILAQSIINQFNSNVDNIALGIYTSTITVTLYSLALQIYNMYCNLSTAIASIYLPSISAGVFDGESDKQITRRVIEPSRMQLLVLLLALTGFLLFGNEFIRAWVGADYDFAYVLTIILLIASTIELSQNAITSVLKAKNKLHGKTVILAISTVVNAIITFTLVPHYGAIGAIIGTAFSLIFGYGIALNIYYYKVIHLDMKLYYIETWKGIARCVPIVTIVGLLINYLLPRIPFWKINYGTWISFAIKACIYAVFYVIVVFALGTNQNEKNRIISIVKRRKHTL